MRALIVGKTLLVAAAMVACSAAMAASSASAFVSQRLDDTGTYTVPAVAQMRWNERPSTGVANRSRADVPMFTEFTAHVRVATQPWIGKPGRIVLVMESDAQASDLHVRWRSSTEGWLAGSLQAGQRTQVWRGTVPAQAMSAQLHMQLASSGPWMAATRRLSFHLEFEPD